MNELEARNWATQLYTVRPFPVISFRYAGRRENLGSDLLVVRTSHDILTSFSNYRNELLNPDYRPSLESRSSGTQSFRAWLDRSNGLQLVP